LTDRRRRRLTRHMKRVRRPCSHLASALTALLALACQGDRRGDPPQAVRASCGAPICQEACECDVTASCDPDCLACDPACGQCLRAACLPGDAGANDATSVDVPGADASTGCQSTPRGRILSETCCPDWGRDACGALLFCAALDGRDQPTCYPERSRADQTPCPADYACLSGSCNLEVGLCRSGLGSGCSTETGCAQDASRRPITCDVSRPPFRCAEVGEGQTGAVCGADDHCRSGLCRSSRCLAAPGEACASPVECPLPTECQPCDVCSDFGSHCVSLCTGLECTEADPAHHSCQQRDGLWAPCPAEAPSAGRCRLIAWRTDFTAIEVRVSWTDPGADGYQVTCEDDDSGARIRRASSGGSAEIILDPVTRGATYNCSVQSLVATGHNRYGWLLGPSSPSCSVVAP
jgi:hypothetical protein